MEIKVALKYCGSCNPQMNLSKKGRTITEIIAGQSDFEIVPLSTNNIDVVIILCGCPRACGNKKEVRVRAKRYLVISVENLSDTSVFEANIISFLKG